jgi:hypothetical protein
LPKKKIKKAANQGKGESKSKPRPIKVVAYNIHNLEKILNQRTQNKRKSVNKGV